jgi:chromodomain-helicase-DNA-binding protein 7
MIIDEAHRLKNHQSRLFSDLATVPRDFCLLLTGTPLQNSTEELWSLLNFSDNIAFASKEDFVGKFGQLSDSKQVSDLHSVLRPYLLRRVKEDVEKSLPPKEETILEVALTPIQKTYYKAIYEKNTNFLFKGSKPGNAPSLMNVMMELRKCCNHPFLIKGAEERIMKDAMGKADSIDSEDPVLRWQKLLADQLIQSSGKMVLLMKLLPKLQAGGHKVLIFSQMVRVLDLLEELLRLKKFSYERLDGSTGASNRAAAVDRFNKKSYQRFVMILSTRAGGLGLNLTSADTVIIFDSDWNPQVSRTIRLYCFLILPFSNL